MILDKRIKVFKGCIFRPQLSMEDVVSGQGELIDVYSSDVNLSSEEVQFSEKALLFLDKPIVYPNMTYLFSMRLRSLDNPILERLIRDLMFLNPHLKDEGVKKMTSWIISFFVGVNDDKKKFITYEDLLPIAYKYCEEYYGGDVEIIESDKIILYKANSLLLSDDKRWHTNQYRNKKISKMLGEVIHQGVILASETLHRNLKISKSSVVEYSRSEEVRTVRKMNFHILPESEKMLNDENSRRYFLRQDTLDKYVAFEDIYEEGKPLDYYVNQLNISKTTALEFRNLKQD